MPAYRSRTSTHGRNMAGARALWRATGMTEGDFGKPIIAIANSFTQFVPGHVHLQNLGQLVAREIEKAGGIAKEFNTIAIDDGIAMGHDGMLYSLPSRDLIADSVEYMVNAHCADAMVCISNCDKITPGMLMAAMRLNIPTIFVSGGPMEAGKLAGTHDRDGKPLIRKLDLIDAMIASTSCETATTARARASVMPFRKPILPDCRRTQATLPFWKSVRATPPIFSNCCSMPVRSTTASPPLCASPADFMAIFSVSWALSAFCRMLETISSIEEEASSADAACVFAPCESSALAELMDWLPLPTSPATRLMSTTTFVRLARS